MSIRDWPPGETANTGAYRAALWCGRITYAWLLVWVGVVMFLHPSGLVVFLTWLGGLPPSVATFVLLRRAGARIVRRRTSWYLHGEVMRHFYRDLLWLPRR